MTTSLRMRNVNFKNNTRQQTKTEKCHIHHKGQLKLFFNLDHKSGRLAAIVIRAFLQHFEKRRFFTGFLGSVRIVLLLPVAHEIVALSLEFLTDLICEFTLDPISASV